MPLNPRAVYVSDTARATALFPPAPCRVCNGSTKVQRYKSIRCEACNGTAAVPVATTEGMMTGNCQECWNDFQQKSTGTRQIPETIPCTACGGQGRKARVHDARPQTLNAMKPGDWVVIAVEFPGLPVEDASPEYKAASAELISCMVIRFSPATSGIITARVIHAPEYSNGHGLRYGDLIQLGPNNILVHSQCTAEEFEKAKQGGLFTFAPVNPIPPVPGRDFYMRGGEKATVWTARTEAQGQFALGCVKGTATNLEWNMDGTERQGRREYDLVQFTEVVNA